MIEVRELRIGNWIDTGEFHLPKYKGYYKYEGEWYNYVRKFKPIKLTEEILLKSNFEISKGRFGNQYDINSFTVYTSEKQTFCFIWDDKFSLDINYLHQLQNLYFALTAQELEVNL